MNEEKKKEETQETTTEKDEEVQLGDKVVGEIELPSIDISQYIGRDTKIERIKEKKGQYGFYIIVETEVIDTIEKTNKEKIELRASRIFGLQQDENGNIGWAKDTKLYVFLKKYKVTHYRDLVGLTVKVQTVTNKKDNKDYLTFN